MMESLAIRVSSCKFQTTKACDMSDQNEPSTKKETVDEDML